MYRYTYICMYESTTEMFRFVRKKEKYQLYFLFILVEHIIVLHI